MRLLVSWVRDFVGVTAAPEEIAERLALRGFEVAALEQAPEGVRPPWAPQAEGADAVIDFEVTANRPDCLSVLGFAREIATLYGLPVATPALPPPPPANALEAPPVVAGGLDVAIEDAEACPRYAAALAEVRPSSSPRWMTARLEAAGVRPISPFVDITNYVLMELGQPMHAFDLARLGGGQIRVRRARPSESITTLDGVTRTLDPGMLVIADAAHAQAVAGVMGGAASEVSAATTAVAFESACFQPASVRRTSKRLGLKTEASSRFERGSDVNVCVAAIERALDLMELVGAGRRMGTVVDRYPAPRGPRTIGLRRTRLALVLGLTVPDADVVRILRALGLAVTPTADGWSVDAPTYRVDLLREIDLIEEVGRHYGFDKLEPAFPPMASASAPPDPRVPRDALIRTVANAAGLSEAVTFGFIESAAARPFVPGSDASPLVSIANPLSATFDVLRPSLLPGLLDAVAHNRRHGRRDVGLFEIGARFTVAGERRGAALAWTGASAAEHWSGSGREVDFFDVKGVVERLGSALDSPVRLVPADVPYLVAGQSAHVVLAPVAAPGAPAAQDAAAQAIVVGVAGLLAPKIVESRGGPRQDKIFVAELDLDALDAARRERNVIVRPLPRYPSVVRDLSVVVAERLSAESIRGTIQAAAARGAAPLVSLSFFDRYTGTGVADGAVSLSVRLTFQAADRTLTDADVQRSVDGILEALVGAHGAVQR